MHPPTQPRYFAVTSPGLSATRWLARVLASHPDVFVAHGKHQLDDVARGNFARDRDHAHQASLEHGNDLADFYESHSLEAVLSRYRAVKPGAKAWGCVHTYTLDSLLRATGSAKALAELRVWNLLRHPVNYIASHESLVRAAECHPALYSLYVERVFPQALSAFPELYLASCPDLKAFFTFVVSVFGAANQLPDLAYYPGFRHVRMEALTTSADLLQQVCEDLTGLPYAPDALESFVRLGAINSHRRSGPSNPEAIARSWSPWQWDVLAVMLPETLLACFGANGYDVAMLQAPERGSTATAAVRQEGSLGDRLRTFAPDHPWLASLHQQGHSFLQAMEARWQGFRLVERGKTIFAVARAIADTEIEQASDQIIETWKERGLLLMGESREELALAIRRRINEPPAPFDSPRLVEGDYKGYNLVSYRGKVYALSQELGAFDLTRTSEDKLRLFEEADLAFGCETAQEARERIDRLHKPAPPRMLEEGYKGYNLVSYAGKVYALSQDLGPFDLARATAKVMRTAESNDMLFVCLSASEARRRIDQSRAQCLLLG